MLIVASASIGRTLNGGPGKPGAPRRTSINGTGDPCPSIRWIENCMQPPADPILAIFAVPSGRLRIDLSRTRRGRAGRSSDPRIDVSRTRRVFRLFVSRILLGVPLICSY